MQSKVTAGKTLDGYSIFICGSGSATLTHAVSRINEVASISTVTAFKSPISSSREVDRNRNGNCRQALLMERFTCRGRLLVLALFQVKVEYACTLCRKKQEKQSVKKEE